MCVCLHTVWLLQLQAVLMELMRCAEVVDTEMDNPMSDSALDGDQSVAFEQLLRSTADLAALDNLDEVRVIVALPR